MKNEYQRSLGRNEKALLEENIQRLDYRSSSYTVSSIKQVLSTSNMIHVASSNPKFFLLSVMSLPLLFGFTYGKDIFNFRNDPLKALKSFVMMSLYFTCFAFFIAAAVNPQISLPIVLTLFGSATLLSTLDKVYRWAKAGVFSFKKLGLFLLMNAVVAAVVFVSFTNPIIFLSVAFFSTTIAMIGESIIDINFKKFFKTSSNFAKYGLTISNILKGTATLTSLVILSVFLSGVTALSTYVLPALIVAFSMRMVVDVFKIILTIKSKIYGPTEIINESHNKKTNRYKKQSQIPFPLLNYMMQKYRQVFYTVSGRRSIRIYSSVINLGVSGFAMYSVSVAIPTMVAAIVSKGLLLGLAAGLSAVAVATPVGLAIIGITFCSLKLAVSIHKAVFKTTDLSLKVDVNEQKKLSELLNDRQKYREQEESSVPKIKGPEIEGPKRQRENSFKKEIQEKFGTMTELEIVSSDNNRVGECNETPKTPKTPKI